WETETRASRCWAPALPKRTSVIGSKGTQSREVIELFAYGRKFDRDRDGTIEGETVNKGCTRRSVMHEDHRSCILSRDIQSYVAGCWRACIDGQRVGIWLDRDVSRGTNHGTGRRKRSHSSGYGLTGCVKHTVEGIKAAECRVQRAGHGCFR